VEGELGLGRVNGDGHRDGGMAVGETTFFVVIVYMMVMYLPL
jgi:hypothetical protein